MEGAVDAFDGDGKETTTKGTKENDAAGESHKDTGKPDNDQVQRGHYILNSSSVSSSINTCIADCRAVARSVVDVFRNNRDLTPELLETATEKLRAEVVQLTS